MRVTSEEGISLIKKFEGCELEAYQCSANVWTIGYGHTRDISEGDSCTQAEADEMLVDDLQEFEGYVNELIDAELTQSQFDALVAWTYNLGPTNLKSSTLLKRLNEDDMADVPHQIRRWNKAGGKVLDGLIRRREAEALLFQGEALGKCLIFRSKTLRF
jgi:lysozyme